MLDAAERFMAKWRKDEADLSRQHHESIVGEAQGHEKE